MEGMYFNLHAIQQTAEGTTFLLNTRKKTYKRPTVRADFSFLHKNIVEAT